ncbi:VPS72-like protein [Mya arenaria]|uniref:Vacuolar protein sorting-associated protein 72 homolog n=1 Tax=Mya arenaria TaxID=6604 RepID=A0ABY7FM79_MYAAR|nr:VPS72-like protein [Mya arenaria]
MSGLASTREKRQNAGAKMASLLEAEDEDDFYKTTYGGFNEEEDDREYESEQSESDVDYSDIDIDEADEVRSDMEDDEPKKRKRGAGVSTKAYKEPAPKKPKEDEEKKTKQKTKEKKRTKPPPSIQIYKSSPEKKSLRKSTAERTKEREEREKERELKQRMLKDIAAQKRVAEVRRLTQEELLEEAKITEELNLQSLENYRRLELEKKSRRAIKAKETGPVIRYHSLTMPLIEEVPDDDDELPAKYFDPVTNTPYATLQAFKIIREAYAQQLQNEPPKKSRNSISGEMTGDVAVKS